MLIETITAKLQADVGDFQAGLRTAEASVAAFQQRTSATMFGKGGFATGQRAAQEIMAAMGKDAATVATTLDRVSLAAKGVGGSMHATTGLTRAFRTGLQALASQAIGLPGPLGRMASALLVFGTGGLVTTAVLAGLAGIAIGIARTKKAIQGLVDEMERIRTIRMGQVVPVGRAGPEQLAALQDWLRGLQEAQRRAADIVRPFQGRPTTGIFAPPQHILDTLNAMIPRQQQILATQRQIAVVTQQIADANTIVLEAVEAQLSIEGQLNEERRLGKLFKQEELAAALALIKLPTIGEELAAKGNKLFKPEDLGLKDLSNNLNKQFAQMGLDAMQSLARSLLTGAKNIKELLFGLLLDFSLGGIFAGIGKALGISGVSNVVAAPTANLSAQPMQLQVGSGNWPPPRTPFDMSRDAEIQRWLREAILVARNQGFR